RVRRAADRERAGRADAVLRAVERGERAVVVTAQPAVVERREAAVVRGERRRREALRRNARERRREVRDARARRRADGEQRRDAPGERAVLHRGAAREAGEILAAVERAEVVADVVEL